MKYRKVIIEPQEYGLLLMDEEGNIRFFQTPEKVMSWVRRIDRATARLGTSTTTTIEWRSMPEGFVPPT